MRVKVRVRLGYIRFKFRLVWDRARVILGILIWLRVGVRAKVRFRVRVRISVGIRVRLPRWA